MFLSEQVRTAPFTLEEFVSEWNAKVQLDYEIHLDEASDQSKILWDEISEPDQSFVKAGCTLRHYTGHLYGKSSCTKMRGGFWVVSLPEENNDAPK